MSLHDLLLWFVPWEPSLLVSFGMVLTVVCYLRGLRYEKPGVWRQCCFWLGLASFYVVLHTQFDYYSEHAFFMHRLQHATLHHMAPFLMAFSRPGAMLLAGIPNAFRKDWLNGKFSHAVISFINHPVVAVSLFCGLILLWLIPSVHFIAMLDWRWYRIMGFSMAADGLMFWNLVLNNFALQPGGFSAVKRIAMMAAVIPPQIAMGVILFLSTHELYPIYSICGRVFEQLSPLADQQIGGLILWNGVMMSVIGILIVMRREWMPRSFA